MAHTHAGGSPPRLDDQLDGQPPRGFIPPGLDGEAPAGVDGKARRRPAQRPARAPETGAKAEVVARDRASPACRPWKVCAQVLGGRLQLTRPPSRAWFIQWLAQQAVPPLLGGLGPTVLLLQVTSRVHPKTGYAWIASRTLTALFGCDPDTVKRYRRTLTAPWRIPGDPAAWWPPLFRLQPVGQGQRGLRRRVHWIPVEAGWVAFLQLLDTASRVVTAEAWGRAGGPEDGIG